MTLDVNLSTVVSSVLSGLALAGIVGIFRVLRKMNNSLVKLQTWAEDHEKLDDERFAGLKDGQQNLWTAMDKKEDRKR